MFKKKEKSYSFKLESLEKIKEDRQKEKIKLISNIIFCIIVAILLGKGVIGTKFIINYVACDATRKAVKQIMK